MRIAIIGAGMAGLACAEALTEAGTDVVLFDKGRGPGGRMSTRRVETASGEAAFDHGAQYFTVRDAGFRERVARWRSAGVVAPWIEAGADAWVGTPTMSAPIKQMAGRCEVRWSAQIDSLTRDDAMWRVHGAGIDAAPFETVVVAIPAEQAAPLLAPWDAAMAGVAADTRAMPCWTVMAAFAERLPVAPDILREQEGIGWAARNSAKPGRSGPESWVIQAGPEWSAEHLEDERPAVTAAMLEAFSERIGAKLPAPLTALAHRWRYARSGAAGASLLWNFELGLGACGDWLLGPRIECAWLSGFRLAAAISGAALAG